MHFQPFCYQIHWSYGVQWSVCHQQPSLELSHLQRGGCCDSPNSKTLYFPEPHSHPRTFHVSFTPPRYRPGPRRLAGCHRSHLATPGGGCYHTGRDQLTIIVPNLGVAEVTDIVRFVFTGNLNIRSENKVDVVSVLVKG